MLLFSLVLYSEKKNSIIRIKSNILEDYIIILRYLKSFIYQKFCQMRLIKIK
jgi:hypothetical protein